MHREARRLRLCEHPNPRVAREAQRRPDEIRNFLTIGNRTCVRLDRRFRDVSRRRNVDPSASTFRVYFSADSFAARIEVLAGG